jgi:hypothetical protein
MELPQALDVGRLQLAEPAPPGVNGLLADLVLPSDFGHWRLVGSPQDRDRINGSLIA